MDGSRPEKMNSTLRKVNVFEVKDDLPLFIEFDCPTTLCNYRCPYCFLPANVGGYKPFENEFSQWKKAVEAGVARIKRPLILSMGPSGEPLVQPKWREFFRQIIEKPNVRMGTFVTNLSRPAEPLLDGVDPGKVGVTATLHPTQFKDHDKDFSLFLERAVYLKEMGATLAVNYVLTPGQLIDFPRYRKIFAGHGIFMTANLLRGVWDGKTYPEAYTGDELLAVRMCLEDIPFIYAYQSHALSPCGNRCTAGRFAVNVNYDGSVYPCYFVSERLGSIFDDALYLYEENFICSSNRCECKWTIPLQEHIVERYMGLGNVHGIVKREGGVKGVHPFV